MWRHITPPFKVSYAHNGMQLWQDTTNACNQFSDNQSLCVRVCALRTLDVTHWKFVLPFLCIILVERTHSAQINLFLLQATLAIIISGDQDVAGGY